MGQAGPAELGERAAEKAIQCLASISRERFGRVGEIDAARAHLSKWLVSYRKAALAPE